MGKWMMAAVAAALVTGGTARAVERMDGTAVDVKIADDAGKGGGRFSGLDYGASDRLGRAWLVLHYRTEGPCPGIDGECELDAPVRVTVPGLGFDAVARQVVYREAGREPVACASLRRGPLPWSGEALVATGSCTYRVVPVERLLDDGFAGREVRREEVHFAVRSR